MHSFYTKTFLCEVILKGGKCRTVPNIGGGGKCRGFVNFMIIKVTCP